MKSIFIIIGGIIFITLGCSPKNYPVKTSDFRVIKATHQPWSGGVAQSGFGVYYELVLSATKENIIFDTIWIDDRAFIPGTVVEDIKDDLLLIYLKYTKKPKLENGTGIQEGAEYTENPPKSKGPDFEGEALIIYTIKGKKKFFEVKQFEKKPALDYP